MSFKQAFAYSKPLPYAAGVGLRHEHYQDALQKKSAVDFVEVHSENFFAEGGMALDLLTHMASQYPLSFHGTAMGLGSAVGLDLRYLKRLKRLVERFKPQIISDHASYSWANINGQKVHMGDLLPIALTPDALATLANNVDQVQQYLGRQILVENIVSYLPQQNQTLRETDFLNQLAELTGCGLLIDINNVLVNAMNSRASNPISDAQQWLSAIKPATVGEIHLAGYTPVASNELIVDDHSQPVSAACWQLYEFAIHRFGPVATLIEWDNALPSWSRLLQERHKAKSRLEKLTAKGDRDHGLRHTASC